MPLLLRRTCKIFTLCYALLSSAMYCILGTLYCLLGTATSLWLLLVLHVVRWVLLPLSLWVLLVLHVACWVRLKLSVIVALCTLTQV